MCADCPTGYAFLEYQWNADNKPTLTPEDSWLKVKGKLAKGNDNGQEYYYIDVASIEVMNERGQETVSN